jgi:signal transduction histidine kinase
MGLAIAQRVIERHGGRTFVESRLGKGAAFVSRLP